MAYMSERETQNSKIIDGRTSALLGPDRRGGGVTHGGVAGARSELRKAE